MCRLFPGDTSNLTPLLLGQETKAKGKEHDIKNLSDWGQFSKTHGKLLEELHIPSKLLRTYSLKNDNRKTIK